MVKHKKSKKCKSETKSDLTIDQQLDVIKKEMEIINKAIGNLYTDLNVKKKLVKGTKTIQGTSDTNQNKYNNMEMVRMVDYGEDKKINIKDEIITVKEELGIESHVSNVEGIHIFDIDSREATKFNEDNKDVDIFNGGLKIKKEMVSEPETCDVKVNLVDIKKNIKYEENTDSYKEYSDATIKTEPCNDDYVCCSSRLQMEMNLDDKNVHSINNNNILSNTNELYKDHIVKEELVIGPEEIQQVSNSIPSPSKKKTCKVQQTKRPKIQPTYKPTQDYICNFCFKRLKSRDSIIKHLSRHKETDLQCPECNKKFSLVCNLRRHRLTHLGHMPYKCQECEKTFQRLDYLQFHMKSRHSGGKPSRPPSTCDLCKKVFSSKCSRDHHKQFACPMNVNKQKCSRKKLYVCDICEKTYPYRSSLSAHILRYHMKKSLGPLHQCDYCGKKYVKKHNLKCHIQVNHLDVLPYKCKKCGKEFKWQCTLATHMKKQHSRQKI